MRLNGNLVLNSGGQSQLDNVIIERLSAAPSVNAAEKGRIFFNTTDNTYYYNNGTNWMAFATGGNAAALQTEVDNLETALGSAFTASGTFNAAAFTGYAAGATDLTQAISQIEAALTAHNTLAELDDVTLTSAGNGQVLYYSAGDWINHTPVLADITDVTATASEVNQLNTAGATTADFVKLHAVTSSAAELNILTGATLSTIELNYVDGVTSSIQTQLDNKQPLDDQLTSIALLTPSATDQFLLGGVDGTYSLQTAAGFRTALGVAIGVDVQAYDLDLVSFAGFAPAVDSSENFTINGASVSHTGLNDIIVGTGGIEGSRWTLERGATARDSLGLGDIATMDQAWFVRGDINAASSNIGKDLSINNFKITNLAPGISGTDAVNKNQLEAAMTGLYWKQSVRAASTATIDLTTGGELTIDGVLLSAGQRVLVKNQTLPAENGIYVVSAGAWTRATDMDAGAEFDGTAVLVEEGTQAYTAWTETATVATVGTDAVSFVQFNGAAGVTAGIGLSKNGNQIDINLGAGIVELPSDEVGIDLYDATSSALILTENATSRSTGTNSKLHLLLDLTGNGKLAQSAAGLKVATNTITEAELTASVAGDGLIGGNGTALAVVSAAGTGSTGGDTPANWAGVGTLTVTADAVGVTLGSGSTNAAPGNHTHKAADVTYSNTTSGLLATSAQSAIDEVEGRVDTAQTNISNLQTEVDNVEASLGSYVLTTGAWSTPTGTNYLNAASSVSNALSTLDTTIKANDTAINNKVNKMYYLYTGGASTSHTVTHNLGQQYCNVTVIDTADEVIVPQSIVFSTANSLVITLNVAIAIKAVVMGLAA